MKKVIIVIACILLVGCGSKEANDITKFKEEYESLNESNVPLQVDHETKLTYLDTKQVVEFLEKKTGIIYFGFPSCPWCRNAIPVLLQVAKEKNMTVYYYDSSNIPAEEEDDFSKVMSILYDHLTENEEGEKTLYVPDIYFLKNGQIVGNHLGTVESQTDPHIALTEEQKEELAKIYTELVEKIK